MKKLPTSYQEFIHLSRYARWVESEGRRETWEETVSRYINYMCDVQCSGKIADDVKTELRNRILGLDVMPSMRCMMTAGEALERDEVAGYNCSYVAVDDPKVFDEVLYILMCLAPDQMIKTKGGDKKMCEVTTDDEVLSFNEDTGQYEYCFPSQVLETPSSKKRKMELEMENGERIRVTEDHKFLTVNRGWIEARHLQGDDEIRNYHEIV